MDVKLLVIFSAIMVGGFVLGMLASVALPRDDEAAAMHRHMAGRARAWLPDRFQSDRVRLQPKPDPSFPR